MENYTKVYFTGVTEFGSCVYGVSVWVPKDYTMNQLVTAIKEAGFVQFMTETMRRFATVR